MATGGRAQLERYLRDQGVSVELIEHAHSESAAAEARAAQLPAEQTAKTVVLHTPEGYRFAVIPASDRLDLSKAAAALDVSRHQLRLATEADMAADFAGYEVGALPPVGPDTPAELIDPRLLAFPRVLCAGGDHEHSLLVDPADIVRLTGARTADIRED
jgi:prolyl-tRNA editing enzyme YbaK/EbsC (Cys-tRNA(Pro) deacylase)